MNLLRISASEAIIEPFFDGGESWPDHEKYACFSQYAVTVAPDARAQVEQTWASVQMLLYEASEAAPAVTAKRSCSLNVSDFDTFILCGSTDNTAIRLTVHTELGEEVVIDKAPITAKEISGNFKGKQLLGIRFELFLLDTSRPGNCSLRWFGVGRSSQTWTPPLHFSPDWPGCFRENYEITPEIGIWFSGSRLPDLREKLQKPPFDRIYQRIRQEAQRYMTLQPESMIEEYLINENVYWTREGHAFRGLLEYLPAISFVGMLEENREMIRLAGRILLSIAVTPHWCESFMGDLPGATWHHRSFLEGLAVKRCAQALDWIGSSLTWHGKNLVYDALMQKGLPRVEADMFSVEYVRKTNQGVVFNNERIFGYLALASRYPRYAKMLKIAEDDFFEMIEDCIESDGGYREGPSYWNYAMENMVETAYVLAQYHKKSLGEFAPERLKKSGDYALSMLCRRPEGLRWFRINDSYDYGFYSMSITAFYYQLTGAPVWGAVLKEQLQSGGWLEALLMIEKVPEVQGNAELPQGLLCLQESGETLLHCREGEMDAYWHFSAGQPYFSHFHEDKGQLVLCVNGEELLCDRGNASAISKKPISHNLFIPESEGLPYSQPADAPGGKVLYAKKSCEKFCYEADLTEAWERGIFERITRTLESDTPRQMLVTDHAECVKKQAMSLRFHSVYPIAFENGSFKIQGKHSALSISPMDYIPEHYTIREDGRTVSGETVYQLVLYLPKARTYTIRTKLEIEI